MVHKSGYKQKPPAREGFIPGTRLLKPDSLRQKVRPEGAPESEGVDITDLPPQEKREITRKNIVSGLAAKKVEELGIIQEMQTAEREKELAPQLAKIGETVEPSENIPELLKEKPGQKAVDIGQAAATGIGTAAATGAGATLAAVKGGALLGTAITPGLGTAIGAAVGLAAGTAAATWKLSTSQRQDIANANKVKQNGHEALGEALNMANQGDPASIDVFNKGKADILLAYKKLTDKSQEKLTWFESFKGQDELIDAQTLVNNLPRLEEQLRIALLNPNPNAIVDFKQFYQGAEQ